MTNLLVTGGAGFIGTNYVRARAAAHPDAPIIVLDAMTYSAKRANLDGLANVTIVEGDIRDEALATQLLRDTRLTRWYTSRRKVMSTARSRGRISSSIPISSARTAC